MKPVYLLPRVGERHPFWHYKSMCLRRRMLPLSPLFGSLTAAAVCAPPTVAKVEPPDWWVGHVVRPAKAGVSSGRQTHRGKSQSPVAWIAERKKTELL